MSEIQNIAILTGSFTIIGVTIGALLEFLRERWRYAQEKERKQNEANEKNRKNYLSPLYLCLRKIILCPLSNETITFKDLTIAFSEFDYILPLMDEIEGLMKTNMDVLPMAFNDSLIFYTSDLRSFVDYTGRWKGIVNRFESRQTRVPTGVLEGFTKLIEEYNNFTNKVSTPIYEMLNRNIIPKDEVIPREKILEMNKILALISESLESEAHPEIA